MEAVLDFGDIPERGLNNVSIPIPSLEAGSKWRFESNPEGDEFFVASFPGVPEVLDPDHFLKKIAPGLISSEDSGIILLGQSEAFYEEFDGNPIGF
jgi:hypothetical protein